MVPSYQACRKVEWSNLKRSDTGYLGTTVNNRETAEQLGISIPFLLSDVLSQLCSPESCLIQDEQLLLMSKAEV